MQSNSSASEGLKINLNQFQGSLVFHEYRTFTGNQVELTEGIKYLCDIAACYWLLDHLLSLQLMQDVQKEQFQVLKLKSTGDCSFHLQLTNGDNKLLHQEVIPFSDFPLKEVTIWMIDGVIFLPSEY